MAAQPVAFGEHLRNRRLTLGLSQEDVASLLGTIREVYDRWERGERVPVVSAWPGILRFLGCYPFGHESAADLVLKARRCQGFDQKQMAAAIGIIHQRLGRWERALETPPPDATLKIRAFTALPSITA